MDKEVREEIEKFGVTGPQLRMFLSRLLLDMRDGGIEANEARAYTDIADQITKSIKEENNGVLVALKCESAGHDLGKMMKRKREIDRKIFGEGDGKDE